MLIIMMGAGEGLYNGATHDMGGMATNSLFMWTQNTSMPYKGFQRGRYYRFNNDDTQALVDNIPELDVVAPRLQGWGGEGNNNVVRGERTGGYNIQGDYPAINIIDPVEITSCVCSPFSFIIMTLPLPKSLSILSSVSLSALSFSLLDMRIFFSNSKLSIT